MVLSGKTMNNILVIYAHPAKLRSKTNKELIKSLDRIKGVTINDIYAKYPDFLIDIKEEQRLCEEHDVIIFQFPLYWYSTPSILKEWQDLVLEHSWAYGSSGNALKGKKFLLAFTAGGDEEMYTHSGMNGFDISEMVTPLRGMANLCKMKWIPPYAIHGIHRGLDRASIEHHCHNYTKLIMALRDENLLIDRLCDVEFVCEDIDSIIGRE